MRCPEYTHAARLMAEKRACDGVIVKSSFQFMSDPTLYREKLLKPAVLLLGRGADQEDETLRVLSLRALGNMALGAPKKVPLPTRP